MGQAKNITDISTTSTSAVDKQQQSAPIWHDGRSGGAFAPFRWAGDDLGLGNPGKPLINFVDRMGNYFGTDSVEWILREIDLFPNLRDQCRLLAGAALHYGLGAYALMGADLGHITIPDDSRHEGALVLLHHNLGITSFTGIAVKSHAGRCGMMLEEALWRFDQFSAADQDTLLAGLAKHFGLTQMHQVRRKTKAAA